MRIALVFILFLYLTFIEILVVIASDVVDEKFFNSARIGDIETLHAYLKQGTPVSARDTKGNTAMIVASGRGKVEAIRLLLEYGANVEDSTNFGLFESKSALSWASSQGRSEAVAILLQNGANPHFPSTRGVFLGKTPLMWASRWDSKP